MASTPHPDPHLDPSQILPDTHLDQYDPHLDPCPDPRLDPHPGPSLIDPFADGRCDRQRVRAVEGTDRLRANGGHGAGWDQGQGRGQG